MKLRNRIILYVVLIVVLFGGKFLLHFIQFKNSQSSSPMKVAEKNLKNQPYLAYDINTNKVVFENLTNNIINAGDLVHLYLAYIAMSELDLSEYVRVDTSNDVIALSNEEKEFSNQSIKNIDLIKTLLLRPYKSVGKTLVKEILKKNNIEFDENNVDSKCNELFTTKYGSLFPNTNVVSLFDSQKENKTNLIDIAKVLNKIYGLNDDILTEKSVSFTSNEGKEFDIKTKVFPRSILREDSNDERLQGIKLSTISTSEDTQVESNEVHFITEIADPKSQKKIMLIVANAKDDTLAYSAGYVIANMVENEGKNN